MAQVKETGRRPALRILIDELAESGSASVDGRRTKFSGRRRAIGGRATINFCCLRHLPCQPSQMADTQGAAVRIT